LINGYSNRVYGTETIENKVKKIASACGLIDMNFSAVWDTFGARCAENGLKIKMLGLIMEEENVEVYYPAGKAAESPLEFLREAY